MHLGVEWINLQLHRRVREVNPRHDETRVANELRPRSGIQVARTGSVLEAADDLLAAAERFDRALGETRN